MVFRNDSFHDERATESVQVARGHIEMVSSFVYLGSCITTDCKLERKFPVKLVKQPKLSGVYEIQSFAISTCLSIQRVSV